MTDKTWITDSRIKQANPSAFRSVSFLMILSDFYVCRGNAQLFHTKIVSRRLSRQRKFQRMNWTVSIEAPLKWPWKRGLFTQITWHTLLRPFYFRTNLWAEYVFKASSFEPERLSCGVFRASECSKRLRCFFRYSSMLFFYGSIPVNQYFLPRLVEGRLNVHDLLGFGSHNSLQDRTY